MRVYLMGYPGDLGGACTEAWHTVRIWRRFGVDVHLIPTWAADAKWKSRLDALGCVTHQATAKTLADVPGLAGATVVSFCNSEFLASAKRLWDLDCRMVWVNCMTWLFNAERDFYRQAGPFDAFVFQSEFQRQQLEPHLAEFGYGPAQGHLIRGAFDAEEWPFSPRPHAAGEAFVVGRAARPDQDKWSSNTWPIYSRIQYRPKRAVMLGMDDRTHAKLGKPPAWADCLGPMAIPAQDYFRQLHCTLPVNGGARENWPRAGLEAMAAGVPIVAQDQWGWREMIDHGVTGFLGGCDEELAHYTALLAYDEDLRMQVVHAARERLVNELANPEVIWAGWRRLLESLVPPASPAPPRPAPPPRITLAAGGPAPSRLWGLTTFFNPAGYGNKLANYRQFRRRFGLPLLTVEIAAEEEAFELAAGDADLLVQLVGETGIWQKEAAINAAVRRLPAECDQVAVVDADLIWERDCWPQTSRLLEELPLVQPFADCVRLPRGGTVEEFRGRSIPAGRAEGQRQVGFAARLAAGGPQRAMSEGHVGFAWAARRDLLEELGLYDLDIMGGGDTILACASVGSWPRWRGGRSPGFARSIDRWRTRWHARVAGRVGHAAGTVYHLWHGDVGDRGYVWRHGFLAEQGYDPQADVRHDENGLLCWASGRLARRVAEYFRSRREEHAA